ncbi:hypothetical protein GCM10027447_35310 [Glycomyces halotolerans]
MNVCFGLVGAVLGIIVTAGAPPLFLAAVALLFAAVIVVTALLFHTGALAYARVTPQRATYRLVAGFIPINLSFAVLLRHGDTIVVTNDGLFIWRYRGGGLERVAIDPGTADPDDWAELRARVASIWPQPPAHSPLGADTAPRARADLAFPSFKFWGP